MLLPVLATGAKGNCCRKFRSTFVYVRQAKTRRQNQVEGFCKRTKCVVVEDLISTGSSLLLLKLCAGANIKGMAAIFTYGFDVAEQNLRMPI
jgi:orotate phosphoribosyltransferase